MLSTARILSRIQQKSDSLLGLTLKASICHKSRLPEKKVYRWPYETKSYNYFTLLTDPFTKAKMDQNSKIVVVEGNVESGKDDFCRRLANELGMKYMPPVNLDGYYINKHGFDYRALNPLLPERLRHCDWEMFHESPNRHSVIIMQINMFKLRLFQYLMAISHILNTGQGVVLNRSAFGEKVIVNAMHDVGWLPKGYLREDGMQFYDYICYYDFMRNLGLARIPPPHCVIYLETPVDICMERIKNSSDPMIANSRAHSREFLEAIEDNYESIMQRYEVNGNTVTYEYTHRATDDEILDVCDDLEAMNWDYSTQDTRFEFWNGKDWFFHTLLRVDVTTVAGIRRRMKPAFVDTYFDIAGMGDSLTIGDLKLRWLLYESQIGDLGFFLDSSGDPRVNKSWIGRLVGYQPYQEKIHDIVYSDCT